MNPFEARPMTAREARRLTARAERIAARHERQARGKKPQHTIGPVHRATVRQRLEREITEAMVNAGLHGHIGQDARALADSYGRIVWLVCHAAHALGIGDAPEVRVLIGSAHALGDIVAMPASLEQHRPAIISGLHAAQRLMPRLDVWSVADAWLELDKLLAREGVLSTQDIEAACGMGGAA